MSPAEMQQTRIEDEQREKAYNEAAEEEETSPSPSRGGDVQSGQ